MLRYDVNSVSSAIVLECISPCSILFCVIQVFTAVFTMECLIKLGALGTDFFRNGWNVFDFVIVLASLVDLGLEIVNGLSVLRGLRLVSR